MSTSQSTQQVTIFNELDDLELEPIVDELPEDEEYESFDLTEILGYVELPILLVDTDPERALARQKEMMEACFDGIGEEKKPEKRTGLAMQQLDVEQRHALRLLLMYQDPEELAAHLQRCLEDPDYGYGEQGANGRTIAQAMEAISEGDIAGIASEWLYTFWNVQQEILSGTPFSFRSLFDFSDLDTFVPLVKRVGDMVWQLGVEREGKHKVFQGDINRIWPQLCDTFVEWGDADTHDWLEKIKKQAAKQLPETILRVARAERLRKERPRIEVSGNQVTLHIDRGEQKWPLSVVLGDQVGLSRLSGHSFYELTWHGGGNVRRFEISGARIKRVPFEHIEQAYCMAEQLLDPEAEVGLEPVTPREVEAAYLRRLKARRAELLPPQLQSTDLPRAIRGGQPVAAYKVNEIVATIIHGDKEAFAYITSGAGSTNGDRPSQEQGVLLLRDEKKGVMTAVPVERGRPMRANRLMSTPLADLDMKDGDWLRALCAWGAWIFKFAVMK